MSILFAEKESELPMQENDDSHIDETFIIPADTANSLPSSPISSAAIVADNICANGNQNNIPDLPTNNSFQNELDSNMTVNETKPYLPKIIARLAENYNSRNGRGRVQKKKRRQQTPKKGAEKLKCDKCDYTTFHKYHLNSHAAVHSSERPFGCDYCSLTFKYRPSLKIHLGRKHNVVLLWIERVNNGNFNPEYVEITTSKLQ